jgi:hypothetical protein
MNEAMRIRMQLRDGLVDAVSIAWWLGRTTKAIQRLTEKGQLEAHACDVHTRRLLYDPAQVPDTLHKHAA